MVIFVEFRMRIASQTLWEHDMVGEAAQMCSRISQCQSYDSALSIIGDYVNITSTRQENKMGEMNIEMR